MLNITVPISSESFCGVDPVYDSDFAALRSEVDRPAGMNPELVASSALRLLRERSRDIRIVAYLALAFLVLRSFELLKELMSDFSVLIADHLDELHPLRPHAREQAFRLFDSDRMIGVLESCDHNSIASQTAVSICGTIVAINASLVAQCPSEAPILNRLAASFAAINSAREAALAAGANTPAAESVISAAPLPQAAFDTPAASYVPAIVPEVLTAVDRMDQIRAGIIAALAENPFDITAHRLLRSLRWARASVPFSENGRTRIEPPDPSWRIRLDDLKSRGDCKNLLAETTRLFACGPTLFLLDLQRYAYSAADEYHDAGLAEAISDCVRELCSRVRLAGLAFADGTPFADSETVQWLVNCRAAGFCADIQLKGQSIESLKVDNGSETGNSPTAYDGINRIILEIHVPDPRSTLIIQKSMQR